MNILIEVKNLSDFATRHIYVMGSIFSWRRFVDLPLTEIVPPWGAVKAFRPSIQYNGSEMLEMQYTQLNRSKE